VRALVVLVAAAALGACAVFFAAPTSGSNAAARNGLIAFTSDRDGDYDIWTMRADGSHLRKLTKDRQEDHCPSWSPDGRWIAFTRRNVHLADLFVMRADGSHVRRVLKLRGAETCPRWSPDGNRLAFVRMDGTLPSPVHAVYTVGVDGRGLRKLSPLNEAWEITDWGRNARILFESDYPPETRLSIWSMRADGSDRRRITEGLTETHRHPRWSPDSRRIAFTNDREGDEELWLMNADGSGMTPLTNNTITDFEPGWSPDGRKLVFARTVANKQPEIFIANADGSGERRLTHWRRIDSEPDWARAR
jgi:Tol biopolymer transport system component